MITAYRSVLGRKANGGRRFRNSGKVGVFMQADQRRRRSAYRVGKGERTLINQHGAPVSGAAAMSIATAPAQPGNSETGDITQIRRTAGVRGDQHNRQAGISVFVAWYQRHSCASGVGDTAISMDTSRGDYAGTV